MLKIQSNPLSRITAWYLSFVLAGVLYFPGSAGAAFITVSEEALLSIPGKTLTETRQALECGILVERLSELGLSAGEIAIRLNTMSPEERQEVLAGIENIQVGGDAVNSLIGVGILALIIVLILKLLDKEIIIK